METQVINQLDPTEDEGSFSNVHQITRILVGSFGCPTLGNKRNPLNELIYIILSSKTSPARYQRAYKELKRACPRFDQLANMDPKELAVIIKFAGLEDKKAQQIIQALRMLRELFGRVTLKPVRKMDDQEAERLLVALPGIGIKSARCILLYSFSRSVFPADNHCLRIANRLGWIEHATFAKGVANKLQRGIPPLLRHDLHVGMILLGRSHCYPRQPRCDDCPLLVYCPTGIRNVTTS